MVEQHNSVLLCINEGEIGLNWALLGENGYFLAACQKRPPESPVFAVLGIELCYKTSPTKKRRLRASQRLVRAKPRFFHISTWFSTFSISSPVIPM